MQSSTCTRVLGTLICGGLMVTACGDDEPELTVTESRTAIAATQGTVESGLDSYRAEGGSGSYAVQCAGGGQATYDGSAQVAVTPVDVDVTVSVAFDDCVTATGLVMSGSVDFSQTVDVDGLDDVQVNTVLNGTVTYSGEIEGTCDMSLEVVVDTQGELVSVQGDGCGHSADDLDIRVSPYWLE